MCISLQRLEKGIEHNLCAEVFFRELVCRSKFLESEFMSLLSSNSVEKKESSRPSGQHRKVSLQFLYTPQHFASCIVANTLMHITVEATWHQTNICLSW